METLATAITHWAEMIMAVVGVLGLAGLGLKRVYTMARNIEATLDAVSEIKKEVKPNGGTSLRDAVNRIDHRVQVLEAAHTEVVNAARLHLESTPSNP